MGGLGEVVQSPVEMNGCVGGGMTLRRRLRRDWGLESHLALWLHLHLMPNPGLPLLRAGLPWGG